jgi:hypothetical protein
MWNALKRGDRLVLWRRPILGIGIRPTRAGSSRLHLGALTWMKARNQKMKDEVRRPSHGISRRQVADFESIQGQLDGLYGEMQKLAAKRPNDALNKFKLKIVSALLERTAKLFNTSSILDGFVGFSEEDLPTNSDVVVVLSQYRRYLEKIRADNIQNVGLGKWYWMIEGKISGVQTAPPRKLRE